MNSIITTLGALFVSIFLMALIAGLLSAITIYFLWNALVPDLFHLPGITFMQAWGLCWLTGLLFKGSSTCTCKKD